jgi:hypothetical protein
MLCVYTRELEMPLGEKQGVFSFSWDFDGWMIHLCKLEF